MSTFALFVAVFGVYISAIATTDIESVKGKVVDGATFASVCEVKTLVNPNVLMTVTLFNEINGTMFVGVLTSNPGNNKFTFTVRNETLQSNLVVLQQFSAMEIEYSGAYVAKIVWFYTEGSVVGATSSDTAIAVPTAYAAGDVSYISLYYSGADVIKCYPFWCQVDAGYCHTRNEC